MAWNFCKVIVGATKVNKIWSISTKLKRNSCNLYLGIHLLFDAEFEEGGEVD